MGCTVHDIGVFSFVKQANLIVQVFHCPNYPARGRLSPSYIKALAMRLTVGGQTDDVVVHNGKTWLNGQLLASGTTTTANAMLSVQVRYSGTSTITVASKSFYLETRNMGSSWGFVRARMASYFIDYAGTADMCSRTSTTSPFDPVAPSERIFPSTVINELEAACGAIPTSYPTLYCGHQPTVDTVCAGAGLTTASAQEQCEAACPCASSFDLRNW